MTTTLWGRTERWSPAVVTTRDIAASLRARDGHAINHAIQTCGPLEYPAQELAIAPYTLGAWLGDGSTACRRITCTDPEILDEIRRDGYRVHRSNPWQHDRALTIPDQPGSQERPCASWQIRAAHPAEVVIARGLCKNHYESERRSGRIGEWPCTSRRRCKLSFASWVSLGDKHIPGALSAGFCRAAARAPPRTDGYRWHGEQRRARSVGRGARSCRGVSSAS